MDDTLLRFLKDNIITLYVGLTLLKGIAMATPWAKDDKIIQLFDTAYNVLSQAVASFKLGKPTKIPEIKEIEG